MPDPDVVAFLEDHDEAGNHTTVPQGCPHDWRKIGFTFATDGRRYNEMMCRRCLHHHFEEAESGHREPAPQQLETVPFDIPAKALPSFRRRGLA